jgi:hypothetical protein
MKLTIETALPAKYFTTLSGHEVCAMIDMVREMIRYNMGPEPAYNSTGPVYSADASTVLATWTLEIDEAPDEGPLTDGDSRRLPYIAKKTSVLQGSDHIAVARSKTMAKRIANALNKHTPNDEGV